MNRKRVEMSMRIETLPLARCLEIKHAGNPKAHELAEIKASIRRFGFVQPPLIDDATNTMTAGHGRCEALEQMRVAGEVVPSGIALSADGSWLVPVVRGVKFASERERDAYVIADNKLPELGGWDMAKLAEMLNDFDAEDFEGIGIDEEELADWLGDGDGEAPESNGREVTVGGHTRVIGAHKARPPVQMTNDDWTLHLGDCLDGLKRLADNSVDAIVTDPPAGVSFMGREWDGDKGGRDQWIAWLQEIKVECLRVLKPGGHALTWALPRTSHWTAFAIENSGFEIRDKFMHVFGSGFPKSLDVSKAIDAKLGAEREVVGQVSSPGDVMKRMSTDDQPREGWAGDDGSGWSGEVLGGPITAAAAAWDGWGTAVKPAAEDWILARKPLDGTVAENVLKHGTGGLNIDACRTDGREQEQEQGSYDGSVTQVVGNRESGKIYPVSQGRWPAHLILSHAPGCIPIGTVEDEHTINVGERLGDGARTLEFGMGKMATTTTTTTKYRCVLGCPVRIIDEQSGASPDELGASRFFYVPKPSRSEKDAGLGELEPRTAGEATGRKDGTAGLDNPRAGGGRTGGVRNFHPTPKSIALMRWLVRLITPPGGTVLDCFAGSGTTGLAALVEGCKFVGFEQDPDYHKIASERLRSIIEDPRSIDSEVDAAPDSTDTSAT